MGFTLRGLGPYHARLSSARHGLIARLVLFGLIRGSMRCACIGALRMLIDTAHSARLRFDPSPLPLPQGEGELDSAKNAASGFRYHGNYLLGCGLDLGIGQRAFAGLEHDLDRQRLLPCR
jgi:hypothetical protein